MYLQNLSPVFFLLLFGNKETCATFRSMNEETPIVDNSCRFHEIRNFVIFLSFKVGLVRFATGRYLILHASWFLGNAFPHGDPRIVYSIVRYAIAAMWCTAVLSWIHLGRTFLDFRKMHFRGQQSSTNDLSTLQSSAQSFIIDRAWQKSWPIAFKCLVSRCRPANVPWSHPQKLLSMV